MKSFLKSFAFVSVLFMVANLTCAPVTTVIASSVKSRGIEVLQTHSKSVLQIKLNESADVVLNGGQFISRSGSDLTQLNALIFNKATSKTRLFNDSYENIKQKRQQIKAAKGINTPDLNSYFRITLNKDENIDSLVKILKSNSIVDEAYAEPLPAEAPTSPDYSGLQSHFNAAPAGMGISAASTYPGALGDRVKVADLEYSWNTSHEDLSNTRQAGTNIAVGTSSDPFNDNNHGTAVAGVIVGDKNGYGINGAVPSAQLLLASTYTMEHGWDIANSIYATQNNLSAGDVMLIEQQTYGPSGHGYVPVEWVPSVYDAIKTATAAGIIVIEPAANGSENLDDPIYGTTFPSDKPDSGAIIVGAGAACNGTSQHSRLSFSNYGRRVNVQGYGECVTTSGYGNLNYAAGSNSWYTSSFNGTSSASATLAAVAAAVSSSYEAQKGTNLTPVQLRDLLAQTGTTQDNSLNPGSIGPLPNIDAAIGSFSSPLPDTTAPTSPTNLSASLTNRTSVNLKWNASTDNSNQITYRIYRNNILIANTTNISFIDNAPKRNTSYTYKLQAVDASNNLSVYSNSLTIKTSR